MSVQYISYISSLNPAQQTLPIENIVLRTNTTSFASWDHTTDEKLTKNKTNIKIKENVLTTA